MKSKRKLCLRLAGLLLSTLILLGLFVYAVCGRSENDLPETDLKEMQTEGHIAEEHIPETEQNAPEGK